MSVKQKSQEKLNKTNEIDNSILKNFDIKKRLGKGAYGIVWQANDKKTQQVVAVKKIFDAFRNETDAQRTFREIMFLRAFRNHPNIIQLHSIHKAVNNMDIYLSFEYMESDLHNVIKRGSILKDVHKRFVMYQLFNAIHYIHSGNVIHRDMKPSNVLVDSQCKCKIADFGLARSVSPNYHSGHMCKESVEPCLTDYVATRWYRAPEILVASKKYTKGIDMWSLGCILGEMLRGKPLFPGTCTVNQIERIITALPEATEKDILSVGAGFGSVLLNNQSSTNSDNLSLDELLSGSPIDAKHLVKSLLLLNPLDRLTAKEAMCHKYIEKFRNTMPEEELNADILPPFRDDIQLSVSEYRSKLYEIMAMGEKIGYMGKSVDKKELTSSITVTPCSNNKKSILIQSTDTMKDDNEKKNHQSIGESKCQSHTLPKKTKEKIAVQNGYVRSNHNSNVIVHKNVKLVTVKNHNDNNETEQTKNLSKSVNYNHKNSKVRTSKDSTQQTTDDILKKKKLRTRIKSSYSCGEKPPLERRPSFDSSLTTNLSKKLHERNVLPDRRPSLDNELKFKHKNGDSHVKMIPPSLSKYKIIKTLQQSAEPNRLANKTIERTHSNCKLTNSHQEDVSKTSEKSMASNMASEVQLSSSRNRNNSEDYYEARFKALEERIRKHKSDYKDALCMKKSLANEQHSRNKKVTSSNLNVYRTRSEYVGMENGKRSTSSKCDEYGQGDNYKFNRNSCNYGIITASDLLKIRSS